MLALLGLVGIAILGSSMSFGADDSTEDSTDALGDTPNLPKEEHAADLVSVTSFLDAVDKTIDLPEIQGDNGLELAFDQLDELGDLVPDELANRVRVDGSATADVLDGASAEYRDTADHLFGNDGNDTLIGGDGDVLIGGDDIDEFVSANGGEVYILDFAADETIILEHEGERTELTLDATDEGISLMADGLPAVHLHGTYSFDLNSVVLKQV